MHVVLTEVGLCVSEKSVMLGLNIRLYLSMNIALVRNAG
jgi:hypothetical protein